MDIKTRVRKFQFSNLKKIQPMNSYLKELSIKIPSDKEAKMGILFDLLLEYIADRVRFIETKADKKQAEEFVEMMLKIFENKIFPIHKLSFMQYLPIFIISLSQISEHCKIFGEKFLSFLIFKAFNIGSKEHLSIRQQSWNYLSSLLSRQNLIIKE